MRMIPMSLPFPQSTPVSLVFPLRCSCPPSGKTRIRKHTQRESGRVREKEREGGWYLKHQHAECLRNLQLPLLTLFLGCHKCLYIFCVLQLPLFIVLTGLNWPHCPSSVLTAHCSPPFAAKLCRKQESAVQPRRKAFRGPSTKLDISPASRRDGHFIIVTVI